MAWYSREAAISRHLRTLRINADIVINSYRFMKQHLMASHQYIGRSLGAESPLSNARTKMGNQQSTTEEEEGRRVDNSSDRVSMRFQIAACVVIVFACLSSFLNYGCMSQQTAFGPGVEVKMVKRQNAVTDTLVHIHGVVYDAVSKRRPHKIEVEFESSDRALPRVSRVFHDYTFDVAIPPGKWTATFYSYSCDTRAKLDTIHLERGDSIALSITTGSYFIAAP
jgi:hypothetical protein